MFGSGTCLAVAHVLGSGTCLVVAHVW